MQSSKVTTAATMSHMVWHAAYRKTHTLTHTHIHIWIFSCMYLYLHLYLWLLIHRKTKWNERMHGRMKRLNQQLPLFHTASLYLSFLSLSLSFPLPLSLSLSLAVALSFLCWFYLTTAVDYHYLLLLLS